MAIKDNEKVYDEQIFPLMRKVIAICDEHDIPLAAMFQISDDVYVSTYTPYEGQGEQMRRVGWAVQPKSVLRPITMALTVLKGES